MSEYKHEVGYRHCCIEGCENKIKAHYWSYVKNDDWFHSKRENKSYCPGHLPDWVPAWRSAQAEMKAERDRTAEL